MLKHVPCRVYFLRFFAFGVSRCIFAATPCADLPVKEGHTTGGPGRESLQFDLARFQQKRSSMTMLVQFMKVHGLTASATVRGQRLLRVQPMATPLLLSRPCQICLIRRPANADLSAWIYRPLIDATTVITACDFHTACAIRTYAQERA